MKQINLGDAKYVAKKRRIFDRINVHLSRKGLVLKHDTIVDATTIAHPRIVAVGRVVPRLYSDGSSSRAGEIRNHQHTAPE